MGKKKKKEACFPGWWITILHCSSSAHPWIGHFFEIMNRIAGMVKQCTMEVCGKEREWKCNFLTCLSRKVPKESKWSRKNELLWKSLWILIQNCRLIKSPISVSKPLSSLQEKKWGQPRVNGSTTSKWEHCQPAVLDTLVISRDASSKQTKIRTNRGHLCAN